MIFFILQDEATQSHGCCTLCCFLLELTNLLIIVVTQIMVHVGLLEDIYIAYVTDFIKILKTYIQDLNVITLVQNSNPYSQITNMLLKSTVTSQIKQSEEHLTLVSVISLGLWLTISVLSGMRKTCGTKKQNTYLLEHVMSVLFRTVKQILIIGLIFYTTHVVQTGSHGLETSILMSIILALVICYINKPCLILHYCKI